jgi:hypothetical protein
VIVDAADVPAEQAPATARAQLEQFDRAPRENPDACSARRWRLDARCARQWRPK